MWGDVGEMWGKCGGGGALGMRGTLGTMVDGEGQRGICGVESYGEQRRPSTPGGAAWSRGAEATAQWAGEG